METISNSLFWISNGLLVPVIVSLVSGKLLLRIRKYLINNIFRGQTPVHDLKCLHLQSVS